MRNNKGQFGPGNQAAAGHENPFARRSQLFRQAILKTVTKKDIIEVIQKLVTLAKSGDIQAIRELLDRCCGKVKESFELSSGDERIEIVCDPDFAKMMGITRYQPAPEPEPLAGTFGEVEIPLDGDDSD